jgi:hypothetical protein
MSSKGPNKLSRFGPYKHVLEAISTRTGAPLPSLVLSFAVLHELTAIVPLVGVFYGARTLGIGERIVTAVTEDDPNSALTKYSWIRENSKKWINEGEDWAGSVGRKYGFFGLDKGQSAGGDVDGKRHHHVLAGDVANAVCAYALTKVCLVMT